MKQFFPGNGWRKQVMAKLDEILAGITLPNGGRLAALADAVARVEARVLAVVGLLGDLRAFIAGSIGPIVQRLIRIESKLDALARPKPRGHLTFVVRVVPKDGHGGEHR